MKAHDKIYVNIPGDYWHPGTDEKVNTDIEYIRKDALLEWAKKELENAELTNFDEFGRGEVIAWKHVLDKLNSM